MNEKYSMKVLESFQYSNFLIKKEENGKNKKRKSFEK